MINIGTTPILSCHDEMLQAHDDGEMHASNPGPAGDEEYWIIYQIDWPTRLYALQNKGNGKFMSKNDARCVITNRDVVGPWEQWTLVDGALYGCPGRIAFRAYDGTIMGANPGGNDTDCGGEVIAQGSPDPSQGAGNTTWPGWWRIWQNYTTKILVDGGLEPLTTGHPDSPLVEYEAEEAKMVFCYWKGVPYSPGSLECLNGYLYHCDIKGDWLPTNTKCRTFPLTDQRRSQIAIRSISAKVISSHVRS